MTAIPGGASRRIFRSTSAAIGMVASAGIAGLLLIDAFVRGGVEQGLLITPWVLLVLWGIYVFSYAPHVRTDADGIRLHNVLNVIDIPWSQVSAIRLRWQLEVALGGRTCPARLRRAVPAAASQEAGGTRGGRRGAVDP